MALPIVPVAFTVLKYGVVAAGAYSVARSVGRGARDQAGEDALDRVPEGLTVHRPTDRRDQANATARWRRVVRLGTNGPGFEIDATALTRLRIKRV